jgi:radical SAM superfamily enzyme YgiQ (UPF0313 family)
MVRIGLVAINANMEYPPMAVAYLNSSLIENDLPTPYILNFDISLPPDLMLKSIKEHNLDVVALSCYVWNIATVKYLAKRIKMINPQSLIILGGPEVSPRARDVLVDIVEADVAVVGEGEQTFPDLIRAILDQTQRYESIKGIVFRTNGKIVENEMRESIYPLDSLPNPYRNFPFLKDEAKILPIETMRGCKYKCKFCYYQKGKNNTRYFSREKVFEYLYYALKESQCQKIYLMDPTFGSDKERTIEICEYIAMNNKKMKTFHTEIRAEEVDPQLASELRKANITDVEVGLQSTNIAVLKNCGRPTNIDLVRKGIEYLSIEGIKTELQLILGLPGETKESFLRSLNEAAALDPASLFCFRLLVLPGTYFFNHAKELGICHEDRAPWRITGNKDLAFQDIVTLMRCSIYACFLFSYFKLTVKYLLIELKQDLASFAYDLAVLEGADVVDEPITLEKQSKIIREHIPLRFEQICKEKGVNFGFYKAIMEKERN